MRVAMKSEPGRSSAWKRWHFQPDLEGWSDAPGSKDRKERTFPWYQGAVYANTAWMLFHEFKNHTCTPINNLENVQIGTTNPKLHLLFYIQITYLSVETDSLGFPLSCSPYWSHDVQELRWDALGSPPFHVSSFSSMRDPETCPSNQVRVLSYRPPSGHHHHLFQPLSPVWALAVFFLLFLSLFQSVHWHFQNSDLTALLCGFKPSLVPVASG